MEISKYASNPPWGYLWIKVGKQKQAEPNNIEREITKTCHKLATKVGSRTIARIISVLGYKNRKRKAFSCKDVRRILATKHSWVPLDLFLDTQRRKLIRWTNPKKWEQISKVDEKIKLSKTFFCPVHDCFFINPTTCFRKMMDKVCICAVGNKLVVKYPEEYREFRKNYSRQNKFNLK